MKQGITQFALKSNLTQFAHVFQGTVSLEIGQGTVLPGLEFGERQALLARAKKLLVVSQVSNLPIL